MFTCVLIGFARVKTRFGSEYPSFSHVTLLGGVTLLISDPLAAAREVMRNMLSSVTALIERYVLRGG